MSRNLVLAAALAAMLGPHGVRSTPPVRPDLKNPWRCTRKGNIVCALDWANGEPAMFLMPYPKVEGGRGYVIPLSRAGALVTEAGTATPTLTATATRAARHMGLDETVHTVNLISDVIVGNVEAIRAMPLTRPAN
jgi:hypothetical protein